MDDQINHPQHYNMTAFEAIDIIKASMTSEEFKGYLKGNIQKYIWRYELKKGVQDLKKAEWYLNRLIKTLEKDKTSLDERRDPLSKS